MGRHSEGSRDKWHQGCVTCRPPLPKEMQVLGLTAMTVSPPISVGTEKDDAEKNKNMRLSFKLVCSFTFLSFAREKMGVDTRSCYVAWNS